MDVMGIGLQVAMIVGAILAMGTILYCAIKVKLNIKYAVVWIIWALFILTIGVFPNIARLCANILGIQTVSNLVFLVMTTLLYALSFYSYIKLSKMNEEMKRLVYEVAILKKDRK